MCLLSSVNYFLYLEWICPDNQLEDSIHFRNSALIELSSLCFLCYREVPRLKQRIAGKSLPIEKFAVFKAKRFSEQNDYLTLPAYVSTKMKPFSKINGYIASMVHCVSLCISSLRG